MNVNVKVKMGITITYPGKINSYEELHSTLLKGALYPFRCSVNGNKIKYNKDGAYTGTHTLTQTASAITDPSDLATVKYLKSNSAFSASSTYSATGSADFYSSETIPPVVTATTTISKVD